MPQRIELAGLRFGRLFVAAPAPVLRNGRWELYWWCRCDCGREVRVRGQSLRAGLTAS